MRFIVSHNVSGTATNAESKLVAKERRGYAIRALTPDEFPQWDAFVRNSPQGTIFHTPLWLEASDEPFKLFGCFRGRDMRAGLATGTFAGRAAGHPHPALTAYMGILFASPEEKHVTTLSRDKEIALAFGDFIKSEFDSAYFRFPPEITDLQPFIWKGYDVRVRYTYRLALTDLETLTKNLNTVLRYEIKKLEKHGIVLKTGAPFSTIMEMSEKSFQRQGLTATFRDAAFRFNKAMEQAGRCRGFVALSGDGRPLAGTWIVWDGKRAYELVAGYDYTAGPGHALAYARWQAIRFALLEARLPEYDFEGSMIPGVEASLRSFGGTLMPTFTISYHKPVSFAQRAKRKLIRLARETITR